MECIEATRKSEALGEDISYMGSNFVYGIS